MACLTADTAWYCPGNHTPGGRPEAGQVEQTAHHHRDTTYHNHIDIGSRVVLAWVETLIGCVRPCVQPRCREGVRSDIKQAILFFGEYHLTFPGHVRPWSLNGFETLAPFKFRERFQVGPGGWCTCWARKLVTPRK